LAQSFSLVFEAGVDLPVDVFRSEYHRCIALLAVLDGPSAVPAPGGVQLSPTDDPVFSFIGDNEAKGVSPVPAVTFHGSPDWSSARWDDDRDHIAATLLAAAQRWLGDATVIDHQVKRWRFAGPGAVVTDPFWRSPAGDLVVCGDAFAGPKFEGAFNSGRAAALSIVADAP
jgi:predicted NAD/FAD-dependent oxidoreductase